MLSYDTLQLAVPAVIVMALITLLSQFFPKAKEQSPRVLRSRNEFLTRRKLIKDRWEEKGDVRGWFTFLTLLGSFYLLRNFYQTLVSTGRLFTLGGGGYLSTVFIFEFPEFLAVVSAQFVACFSAYFSQRLILATGPRFRFLLGCMQFFWMSMMLGVTCSYVYRRYTALSLSFRFAAVAQCMVLCMKMHSYMRTNSQLAASTGKTKKVDGLSADAKVELQARGLIDGAYAPGEEEAVLKEILEREDFRAAVYPKNVTLWNYVEFLFMPVLVYEPRYPRSQSFSLGYLVQKVLEMVLLGLGIWQLLEFEVNPRLVSLGNQATHPLHAVLELMAPVALLFVFLFFVVFDCILPGLAEITFFADREFYGDWWNCTTFEEFSRKWNKPVHEFLLRHVMVDSHVVLGISRRNAAIFTFLVSIVLHEILVTAILSRFTPYLAYFSLLQIPLLSLMRSPVFKGAWLGNISFWSSLLLGLSLIVSLYFKEYCSEPFNCNIS